MKFLQYEYLTLATTSQLLRAVILDVYIGAPSRCSAVRGSAWIKCFVMRTLLLSESAGVGFGIPLSSSIFYRQLFKDTLIPRRSGRCHPVGFDGALTRKERDYD